MTFPTFEDYKAPWEKDEDGEFDAEKAKKLLYNLDKDKYILKGKSEKADEQTKEVQAALEVYKEAEAAAKREGETEVQRLSRENAELQEKLKAASSDTARENLLLKVRLEKGLTEKQVKRISGETLEELLADADDYLADAGVVKSEDEEDEGEEEEVTLRRKPVVKKTPGDPNPALSPEFDMQKALDSIPRL